MKAKHHQEAFINVNKLFALRLQGIKTNAADDL